MTSGIEPIKKQTDTVYQSGSFNMVPIAGVEPAWYCYRGILSPLRLPISPYRQILEAPPRFGLGVKVLQTSALPLGYGATVILFNVFLERETGFGPATFALARQRSTTEPLPHNTKYALGVPYCVYNISKYFYIMQVLFLTFLLFKLPLF